MSTQSLEAPSSSQSQFLLRAAAYYDSENALDNQTEMFLYIWNALADEEQEEAMEIWRRNPKKPAPISVDSIPQCGIDLIKEFEGYHDELSDGRARAYKDAIHGWNVPTIGYGTTKYPDGRKVKPGDVITRAEAEEYLTWEVEKLCRPQLEKIPTWIKMNENQRGALYSFAYNLGSYFFGGRNFTSITRVCNSPDRWSDDEWVTAQFIKYRNPGSPAEKGLRRRRSAEAQLFLTSVS
ncbi:MAG: lysozyme [Spirulina sp.]